MPRHPVYSLAVAILLAARAGSAQGVPPSVQFAGAAVSVVAEDARASDVLKAWASQGGVRIDGVEQLEGRRITVKVVSVDEDAALRAVIGPDYEMVQQARITPVDGASRFVSIAIRAHAPAAVPTSPSSTSPEARFSYTQPSHAISTTDIILTDAKPRSPDVPAPSLDPESRFDYGDPARNKFSNVPDELRGGVNGRPPAASRPRDPEAEYDYTISRRAQELAARHTSAAPVTNTPGPLPVQSPRDPETRFAYFHSAKASAPLDVTLAPAKHDDDDPDLQLSYAPLLVLPGTPVAVTLPAAWTR
jgi:hypothetical protein